MDHSGPIPMVSEFGLTPESNFLSQAGPQSMNMASAGGPPPDHIMGNGGGGGGIGGGPRSGSPEFMTSGNFSEPQNMLNEGVVW